MSRTLVIEWRACTYAGYTRRGTVGPFDLHCGDEHWSAKLDGWGTHEGKATSIHEARETAVSRCRELLAAIDPEIELVDPATREAFECELGADGEPADSVAALIAAALARHPYHRPSAEMLDDARALARKEAGDAIAAAERAAERAASIVRSVLDDYAADVLALQAECTWVSGRYSIAYDRLREYAMTGALSEVAGLVDAATAPASSLIDDAWTDRRVRALYYLLLATDPKHSAECARRARNEFERYRALTGEKQNAPAEAEASSSQR